jgi:plastocyanin
MNSIARSAGLILLAGLVGCGGGPGAPKGPVGASLAFRPVQAEIAINTPFVPPITVEVHDVNGAVVDGSSANILLYIRKVSPQPLSGTLSLRADHGVATFADLVIDSVGTYQIVAKSSGLDRAVSTPVTSDPPSPPPGAAEVTVGGAAGAVKFTSGNGSSNPAVDTLAVNGTVTWTWAGGTHGVKSVGDPQFVSSDTSSVLRHEYTFTFTHAGSYFYNCIVHRAAMSGKIVVVTPPPVAPRPR